MDPQRFEKFQELGLGLSLDTDKWVELFDSSTEDQRINRSEQAFDDAQKLLNNIFGARQSLALGYVEKEMDWLSRRTISRTAFGQVLVYKLGESEEKAVYTASASYAQQRPVSVGDTEHFFKILPVNANYSIKDSFVDVHNGLEMVEVLAKHMGISKQ